MLAAKCPPAVRRPPLPLPWSFSRPQLSLPLLSLLLLSPSACSGPPEADALEAGAEADDSVEAALGASTVWQVNGSDARGSYTGRVELTPLDDAGNHRFVRVIDYAPSILVEDGRTLSWVWEGSAKKAADGSLGIVVRLQKADFVKSRGPLVRTAADAQPVVVRGQLNPAGNGLTGSFAGPEIAASETWSSPAAGGAQPIFARRISELPTHDVISDVRRQAYFSRFASFHALPEVKPYVDHPDFKNPVHRVVQDRTDFGFYQAHPKALRVVGKVIDAISLQETLARADAFKWKLSGKAAFYDDEVAKRSIDPKTGMLFELVRNDGVGLPSHDSALWTGVYVASQAYRFRVTRAPVALQNVLRSVKALLTLAEITGDRRTFARTLRQATPGVAPTLPWHAGTGAYAGLEWKEGGNNDMFKGLMFGMASTWALVCEKPAGYDALCNRIRSNAKQIADSLDVAQDHGLNRLAAQWLAAYTTGSFSYLLRATEEWNLQSQVLERGNVTMVYEDGVADWSGTHLSLVQYLNFSLLADRMELPGIDAGSTLRRGIDKQYHEFRTLGLGGWSVAFSVLGKEAHPDAAASARWRLRELPAPKTQLQSDHRIRPDYVMSPFPSHPWKEDWTQNDRTQSLRSYPLFESTAYTVYDWKQSPLEYRSESRGVHFPGADYLLAYWLGRHLGVLTATE